MIRQATSEGDAQASWRAFVTEPASYIGPAQLAACFHEAIDAEACLRLLGTVRLRARLSALILRHYGISTELDRQAVDDADCAIALLDPSRLGILARRAGAIFWAGALASVVVAQDYQVLRGQLGAEVLGVALRHRDLAGPERVLPAAGLVVARVDADGWRCLAAWCDTLPAGWSRRVRLKLHSPVAGDAAAIPSAVAARIVRAAGANGDIS